MCIRIKVLSGVLSQVNLRGVLVGVHGLLRGRSERSFVVDVCLSLWVELSFKGFAISISNGNTAWKVELSGLLLWHEPMLRIPNTQYILFVEKIDTQVCHQFVRASVLIYIFSS